MEYKNLTTKPAKDYELLDSGDGFKLERFGSVTVSRPDPQVLWEKQKGLLWQNADAQFITGWQGKKNVPINWTVTIEDITFSLKLSSFKHVGIFPEQVSNWQWIKENVKNAGRPVSVLNLFGYTGGATLAALSSGGSVVHVDGSKVSLSLAKHNAELSKLSDKPVRWILDDALEFAKREVRRGNTYDAIIMDPPAFGHGPKGEEWKIERDLPTLIEVCSKLLAPDAKFFILNGYAAGYSPVAYAQLLEKIREKMDGTTQYGELSLSEAESERLLPAGIYARVVKKVV